MNKDGISFAFFVNGRKSLTVCHDYHVIFVDAILVQAIDGIASGTGRDISVKSPLQHRM